MQCDVMYRIPILGETVEEAEARKQHAEERRQQALQQDALHQEQRLETRWPYVSPCGKVQLTHDMPMCVAATHACMTLVPVSLHAAHVSHFTIC